MTQPGRIRAEGRSWRLDFELSAHRRTGLCEVKVLLITHQNLATQASDKSLGPCRNIHKPRTLKTRLVPTLKVQHVQSLSKKSHRETNQPTPPIQPPMRPESANSKRSPVLSKPRNPVSRPASPPTPETSAKEGLLEACFRTRLPARDRNGLHGFHSV